MVSVAAEHTNAEEGGRGERGAGRCARGSDNRAHPRARNSMATPMHLSFQQSARTLEAFFSAFGTGTPLRNTPPLLSSSTSIISSAGRLFAGAACSPPLALAVSPFLEAAGIVCSYSLPSG